MPPGADGRVSRLQTPRTWTPRRRLEYPLDALNLQTHAPEEYAGKAVDFGGASYVVGPLLGGRSKYFVHALVNARSGLALHVIKVRRDHGADPAAARVASHETARAMALIRDRFRRDGSQIVIPFAFAVDGAGGTFEVHDNVDALGDPALPATVALLASRQKAGAGDTAGAIVDLRALLDQAPAHTVAWNDLGVRLLSAGDAAAAYDAVTHAVLIEPNLGLYRFNQALFAARAGYPTVAASRFLMLHERFPALHDHDEIGLELLLEDGRPEAAAQLTEHLPDARRDEISATVHAAIASRAEARRLASLGRPNPGGPDAATRLAYLAAAELASSNDWEIRLNHALTLMAVGQWTAAADALLRDLKRGPAFFLGYRLANAAYCHIQREDWAAALPLLHGLHAHLTRNGAPPNPFDLPSVATWWDGVGVTEERPEAAAELLTRAAAVLRDPTVQALAGWYQDAVHAYPPLPVSPPEAPPPSARLRWWERVFRWRP